MEERATTPMAATIVSASTAGQVMTAARTSMTAPVQLAIMAQPATTAWPHSSASVLTDAQVRRAAHPPPPPPPPRHNMQTDSILKEQIKCDMFAHPGLLCHLDDACISNPCQKGSNCDTNPVNGKAICTCPPGYTGAACNLDIDECSLGKLQVGCFRGFGSRMKLLLQINDDLYLQ